MKSVLRVEFESDQEIADFIRFLNPKVEVSELPGSHTLDADFPNLREATKSECECIKPEMPEIAKEFLALKEEDIAPGKLEAFKDVRPAVKALIKETFKEPSFQECVDAKMERVFDAGDFEKQDKSIVTKINSQEQFSPHAAESHNWKPTKTMGICDECGIPFTRLHNRVKWCDSCRSKRAIEEASKKGKRSGRKSG